VILALRRRFRRTYGEPVKKVWKERVLIRTTFQAEHLGLEKGERLTINCGSDPDTVITIEHSDLPGKLICTALASVTPSARVAEDFAQEDPQAIHKVDQFLTDIIAGLSEQLRRVIRVFMWRRGLHVEYSLPAFAEASWSFDGHTWNPIRNLLQLHLSIGLPIKQGPVPAEITDYVGSFVANGGDEPLARQLLREAWVQKSASARSALVLAIAAAEVGFKRCVSQLVPEARWLVEEVPSPPLYKMLTEYLPHLPVKLRLTGKTLLPPEDLLREIRTGVNLRNQVSHLGNASVTLEKLDRILKAVSDLLWILDFYQGHEWAIRYVQQAVLGAWKSDDAKS
jgi:hypothetical protein